MDLWAPVEKRQSQNFYRLMFHPMLNINDNIKEAESHKLNYEWFASQVTDKGPWDYKIKDKAAEDFGNFNYGATGKAAGFSKAVLLRMAGWKQVQDGHSQPSWGVSVNIIEGLLGIEGEAPFGDDPKDQAWIKNGFQYYDSYIAKRR